MRSICMSDPGAAIRACALLSFVWCVPQAWSQTSYLDNGVIRIGVDLTRGGAISYLSESGSSSSVVNIRDLGRYVQQSFYSGPDPFIPVGATQHPAYAGWGWNPVQAGDVYGNRSQVLSSSNDGTTLYVESIPKQWALSNVDSECTMETWITLDQNRADVRCRLTNYRADTTRYSARHQELPAVYTVGTLHRLFTYTGSAPFTGASLTQIVNNGPPWEYWNSTENWAALVNNQDWGVGIYHPGAYLTVGGFHGTPGSGGPSSVNTGYISPLLTELLDHDIVYAYNYTLILGDLHDDIRAFVYADGPDPRPTYVFGRDRQSFQPVNLTDPTPPYAGHWPLTLDQPDPQLKGPEGWWDAADVPVLYIRAAYDTSNDEAEVFFAGEDGVFTGSQRLTLTIIPDGEIRTHEVDLSSHALYTGPITRVRFDPIISRVSGDRVDLYSITSEPPSVAVPAVSEWGIAVMYLLTLTAATLMIARRGKRVVA